MMRYNDGLIIIIRENIKNNLGMEVNTSINREMIISTGSVTLTDRNFNFFRGFAIKYPKRRMTKNSIMLINNCMLIAPKDSSIESSI